jgi:DNA-binding MarR family transcriptional regulator/AmiR/NasT family two-component response regulator
MPEQLSAPAPDVIFDTSILVVCEDRNRLGFYRDMMGERGYHVISESDPAHIAGRLLRDRSISVIFLDIGAAAPSCLESLRAQGLMREGVEYVIASEADEEIAAAPHAERLVKPFGREQLLGAVGSAFNLARMQRFRQEEMRELESSLQEFKSRTLAAVSQFMARTGMMRPLAPAESGETQEVPLQALVAEECRRARLRGRIFGALGLSHSNWLLLLVMAEAQWSGTELTVKSAAYSAGLPLSSALRKINEMCASGLITKTEDPHDARRSFVALTASGQASLTSYLSELAATGGQRDAS